VDLGIDSSGGIPVTGELKWDARLKTRRGECKWALRELKRAPFGDKIASSLHAQADSAD
jgi:hypothetical protein